jgi:hypothetical protein
MAAAHRCAAVALIENSSTGRTGSSAGAGPDTVARIDNCAAAAIDNSVAAADSYEVGPADNSAAAEAGSAAKLRDDCTLGVLAAAVNAVAPGERSDWIPGAKNEAGFHYDGSAPGTAPPSRPAS